MAPLMVLIKCCPAGCLAQPVRLHESQATQTPLCIDDGRRSCFKPETLKTDLTALHVAPPGTAQDTSDRQKLAAEYQELVSSTPPRQQPSASEGALPSQAGPAGQPDGAHAQGQEGGQQPVGREEQPVTPSGQPTAGAAAAEAEDPEGQAQAGQQPHDQAEAPHQAAADAGEGPNAAANRI